MTAAAMATAAPAIAPLLRPDAPLMKTGRVVTAGAGAGVVLTGTGAGATVVTTQMGVAGTLVVVQGVMMVTVASWQVVAGSSHMDQGARVVQSTATHSVAMQVTVAVHQWQTGRVVGCHGLTLALAGDELAGGAGRELGGAGKLDLGTRELGSTLAELFKAAAAKPERKSADAAMENFISIV